MTFITHVRREKMYACGFTGMKTRDSSKRPRGSLFVPSNFLLIYWLRKEIGFTDRVSSSRASGRLPSGR